MSSVLNNDVLVLNRFWIATGICNLKRAITLCWKQHPEETTTDGRKIIVPYAQIVDALLPHYPTYTWEEWELQPIPDGEPSIRGSRCAYRIPNVIVLTKYDRLPWRQRVNFSKHNMYKRDAHQCQYCSKYIGGKELSCDHIIPKSQGGLSTWGNCVTACVECNTRKAGRTPDQANMKLLRWPTKPKYSFFKHEIKKVPAWGKFVHDVYWDGKEEKKH